MTDFTPLEAPATDIQDLPIMHPGRPVGRDALLKDIYTHLQNKRPVLLYGEPGNGKTTLAAALAAAFVQQPGGVIWLNTRTHPLPALLVQVGRALGVQDITGSEQPSASVGALAAALTRQKPLIVLDNVQDALAPAQFISKAADTIPLVMISATELEGDWETVHVNTLTDSDSVTLFKQKSGIQDDKHDIDIYGITKLLAYRPFALVLAARGMVAAKQTPAEYFKNLKTVSEQSGDPTLAAIALSYRSLNNALQGLILMLGATFTGQGSVDYISAVSGVPEDGIIGAMKILSQLYLVEAYEVYDKAYYRMHPRVYQFAQNALTGKNQLATLQQKVHDATLKYAEEHQDNPQALAKEMENFIAVARWTSDNGDRDTANKLVSTLTEAENLIQEQGYVYEMLTLRNLGSGSTQAFPAYDPDPPFDINDFIEDEAEDFFDYEDEEDEFEFEEDEEYDTLEETILDNEDSSTFQTPDFGDLNIMEGMDSRAIRTDALQGIDVDQMRQALAQAKQQDDQIRVLQILKAIGKVQVGQKKETEAITTYNEILEIYEEDDDEEGILDTLNMLGSLLTKTGNSQAAVMHATRGIQMAKDAGDSTTELQMHMILGDARQDLGETTAAVESLDKALEIARKTGDRQYEALVLYKLGSAHLDNGSTEDATHSLDQARELFKEQLKRDYEGRVLGTLGSAYSELEQWSEAIGYYTSALYIAREVEDKDEERLQLSNLAQAQEQAGRVGDALKSYRQALHLAYESDDREEIVSAIVDLVRLLLISPVHLDIANMLLADALDRDPEDKDVLALFEEVSLKKQEAARKGKEQKPVTGDAKLYAENAYILI